MFTTAGSSPISGFSKAKARLDAEIRNTASEDGGSQILPDWHIHDIRRTVATHMEDAIGIPRNIVGMVLNHAVQGITGRVYTQGDLLFERQRALSAWGRLLTLALEGGPVWPTVAAILRPRTEADAARALEFRRAIQADDATWATYLSATHPDKREAA